MAHTVGKWALRVPDLTDSPDIPANFANLATDLGNVAMDTQGAIASRPTSSVGTPGIAGRYFRSTDETPPRLYRDNGAGWDRVAMSTDQRAYDKLDEQVGSGVAGQTISFLNIPQGYRHLRIEGVTKSNVTSITGAVSLGTRLRMNQISTVNIPGSPNASPYLSHKQRVASDNAFFAAQEGHLTGTGGFGAGQDPTALYVGVAGHSTDMVNGTDEENMAVSPMLIDIFDYSATDRWKAVMARSSVLSSASGAPVNPVMETVDGAIALTAALTRIDLYAMLSDGTTTASWTSKTRLALYGIS